MSSKIKW